MKKVLPIFIALFLVVAPSFAIEEVALACQLQEKTLREKLVDVYNLEIEQIEKPKFLLEEVLTKHYDEDSFLEKGQFWAGYVADYGMFYEESGSVKTASVNHYMNIGYDGYLKNKNADFRLMLNISPNSSRNMVQNMFHDVYIATNKVPHHRLMVGNMRPPVGMEGGYSPYTLPFIMRSQIARNFGSVRKLGARAIGDYSFIDYDLGVYSSDTYFQEFFPGAEFIGWVNFKPLGKTDGRYGQVKVGGGLQAGNRDNSYNVVGTYIGWEYKKWWLNFEWADANGYNGPAMHSIDKHASGFYTTLAYKITPKLQALLRYDEFDPNKDIKNNNRREYVLGLNYFIKGQGLKLVMNYVLCQNDAQKDSHRLILGTQLLL